MKNRITVDSKTDKRMQVLHSISDAINSFILIEMNIKSVPIFQKSHALQYALNFKDLIGIEYSAVPC